MTDHELLTSEARALLAELATHLGNQTALDAALFRWLDVMADDAPIALAWVVRVMFAECLILKPLDEHPPGSHRLDPWAAA